MVAKVASPKDLELKFLHALPESRADNKALNRARHSPAPFLVVDRSYLDHARQKPKELYIARPPTWADVVHGANPETGFLERDQYGSLLLDIRPVAAETPS